MASGCFERPGCPCAVFSFSPYFLSTEFFMNLPSDLKYTPSHEWVRVEADASLSVGITDHAQDLLGDLVFVEAPAVGRTLVAGEESGVLESVKAAADLYSPVAGTVVAINGELTDAPERINQDAYAAWIFRLQPANAADLDTLMDAASYRTLIDAAE
jgi:glycine cleavage system H protein